MASASILFLGNGLQGILLPVRAGIAGFPTIVIGLIASAYSAGFIGGCLATPWLLRRVGHIRAFAVLAAVASAVVLGLAMIVDPKVWLPLRALSGFVFAGLFMVIESWLNERAGNAERGRIFSRYMVINLVSVTIGQLLLALGDPAGFELFAVVAIAISLSLVPVGVTTTPAPTPPTAIRLRIRRLYAISPVGVVGVALVGLANGANAGLAPIYAQRIGLPIELVAVFVSVLMLGGALSQVPVGRLSDRTDRRYVIILACIGALVFAVLLLAAAGIGGWRLEVGDLGLILLVGGLGFMLYPLYSLCVAHANDFIAPEEFVEASGGLLLVWAVGATVGPFIASLLMETWGPAGLPIHLCVVELIFIGFVAYRLSRRIAPAPGEREAFVSAGLARATPVASQFDPRAAPSSPGHDDSQETQDKEEKGATPLRPADLTGSGR